MPARAVLNRNLNRIPRPPIPYLVAARTLHRDALSVATHPARPGRWADLAGHRHMLLVSFRRDGTPVPTPLWFAAAGEVLYARSEADVGKVKRIRRDPRVLVAPCDRRGRPLGPPRDGRARVLASSELLMAETLLAARYGIARRVLERVFFRGRRFVYLEVRPMPDSRSYAHTGTGL